MKKEIYLAGGCFWGMEKLFRSFRGVENVTTGYANIIAPEYASYKMVCTGLTEARETVKVEYDTAVLPLEQVLKIYFAAIDPTVANQQAHDIGTQYQTGIYWTDEADAKIILSAVENEAKKYPVFCVEYKPLKNFCTAEEYHQRYLEKNPGGYCHISPLRILQIKQELQPE